MKVNLGCGRNPRVGWVNVDRVRLTGVDVVADLDDCSTAPLPFDDNSVDEILGVDLIEHIARPLPLMQELWRISAPGAVCTFVLPYGTSDDAWEDPTHVRPYFVGSWGYFGQPFYWRADYGYRGDWETASVTLAVDHELEPGEQMARVQMLRNVVSRQEVRLTACKPARPCDRALIAAPPVRFVVLKGR
jgi:SAM-dependent methyltransferase